MASKDDKVINAEKSGAFDISPAAEGAAAVPAPFKFNFGAASTGAGIDLGSLKIADNLGEAADDSDDSDLEEDDGEDEGDEEALHQIMNEMPPEVLARVLKLKGLDEERSALVKEYNDERCALEAKYRALYAPLYSTRAEVVSGRLAVPLPDALSHHTPTDASKLGVPKFWLQAMARRGILAELIEESDIEALGYVEDIKCVDNEKMDGFTLEFIFGENPYFHNKTLTKTYEVATLLTNEEPVLEKVIGTEIQWKQGKNLAFEEKQKKQRAKKGKNKGNVRYVTEKSKIPSFFHFFNTVDVQKLSSADMDEAEAEEMMERLNMDYTAANLLRTEVVPQAVLCYTGELQDSDDEDFEDDEDDDEDSEEDSDEEEQGKGRKGGKKGRGKGGKGGNKSPFAPAPEGEEGNPECKQS